MRLTFTEWIYCIFLLLLPFAFSTKIIDPALMPRQLLLGISVIILVLLAFSGKIKPTYFSLKSPIYLSIAAYFLFAFISFAANKFTAESHAVLSKQLLVFSFLILTTALLRGKIIRSRTLIIATIGFGWLAIGSAIVQIAEKTIYGQQQLFRQIEIVDGLFANKNLLSSILFLCLPFFALGITFSRWIRIASAAGLMLSLAIIIIIRTRAVMAATAVFLLLLFAFWLRERFKIKKITLLICSLALIAAAVFTAKNLGVRPTGDVSKLSARERYLWRVFDARTLKSRTLFWDSSLQMYTEHPLLGVGAGNWQVEFPRYGLAQFKDREIVNGVQTLQRAHNDLLQVLCENGPFSFVAYLAIFIVLIYQLIFLLRRSQNPKERWHFAIFLAGVLGYLVVTFLDFPLERIEHQVLLSLLMAISFFEYHNKNASTAPIVNKPVFANYAFLGIGLYGAIVAACRLNGEAETAKMYLAKETGQWDETLFRANKAENFFYTTDPTSIPIDWFRGIAYFSRNELGESISSFEKAYQMAPYQIQVINNLGAAWQANGDSEKALQYFNEALRISPDFEEARLNLAGLYYNNKDYATAFSEIDKIAPDTRSKKYELFLAPILAKEINRILDKNGNPALTKKVAAAITSSKAITDLYRESKKRKLRFEQLVLDY